MARDEQRRKVHVDAEANDADFAGAVGKSEEPDAEGFDIVEGGSGACYKVVDD